MAKSVKLILVSVVLITAVLYLYTHRGPLRINPKEAMELIRRDSSVVVLDVRTAEEYTGATGHLPGALLIPVQDLNRRLDELQQYKHRMMLVYCRSGHRSTTASEILQKNGYRVRNMEGGITRWIADSLPVVKGTR